MKVLPEIVRSASEPLSNVDKISIISTDGASDLSKTVAANVAQGLELASDLTGVDIRALLGKLGGAAGAGTVDKPAAGRAPATGGRRRSTSTADRGGRRADLTIRGVGASTGHDDEHSMPHGPPPGRLTSGTPRSTHPSARSPWSAARRRTVSR